MCGISGFCNLKADYLLSSEKWHNILIDMRESLAHRGNDDTGEYLSKTTGLSQTRLSIRDLKNGRQPIIKRRQESDYVIIYNGEIYNTDALKADLKTKGYQFETTTDTEVILNLFMEYREGCVNKLNGIFAFAIWDSLKNKLYLFRDRNGIKPLFYTIKNDTLIFASEIKALFKFPDIVPEVDINSFREVIGIGPARTAGCGVFKNIYELKPAEFAVFDEYGFKTHKYWQLKSKKHTDNYNETVEKTRFLLENAIKDEMVSDVEVCTFLSGGIDSSIVTAVAYNYLKNKGQTLNTFSFDFTENDIYFKANSFQPERDKPFVDMMLKVYPSNHTYLECDEAVLADYLYSAVEAKDLPGMADVDASLLYFCQKVKEKNKVTLTGECADEIFGGYPWFHREEFFNADSFPWTKDLEPRKLLFNKDFINKLDIDEYSYARYKESLEEVPQLEGENKIEQRRREISYLNMKWFMTTLLDRMDRTSMYSGLEARVPFAEYKIIEYLWNVPWEYKCPNGIVKGLLRDAFKDLLPEELITRKKSPYPKTYNPKYEKILCQRLLDIVNDNNSIIAPILDKKAILSFINEKKDYGKPWFGQLMSGVQLIAYVIQMDYWLKKYNLSLNNIK